MDEMTVPGLIVVGIDDSASSIAAHRWAAQHARTTGSVLRAVHVLTWPVGLAASAVRAGTRLVVPHQDVASPYRKGMSRVFSDVASPEGSHLQFAQGDVADVLIRISGNADLLVLGARRPLRSRAYLDGPVARACIAGAGCPVTTVPVTTVPVTTVSVTTVPATNVPATTVVATAVQGTDVLSSADRSLGYSSNSS